MAIQIEGNSLFAQDRLSDVLNTKKRQAQEAVSKINPDELLSRPSDHIASEIFETYQIPMICLDRNKITAPQIEEASADVRGDFSRGVPNDRPTYVPAVRISLRVPYSGGLAILFRATPSTFTLNPPCGYVYKDSVVVTCLIPTDVLSSEKEKAINALQHKIDSIEKLAVSR